MCCVTVIDSMPPNHTRSQATFLWIDLVAIRLLDCYMIVFYMLYFCRMNSSVFSAACPRPLQLPMTFAAGKSTGLLTGGLYVLDFHEDTKLLKFLPARA